MLTPTGVTMADYIAAVKSDAPCHVRMTFTEQGTVFTDDDIEQSGTSIASVLNGDTNLTFGKAVMATMHTSLFISGKTMQLIWDKEFKLEVGLEVGNSTEWTTIGYFSGERPEKLSSMGLIDFTAKDRMHKFDILADDWLKSLTYPKTLKQLYDSLCAFVGIQNESGDELSAIMSRSFSSAPIVANGLLCRDILALIAEAAGCYAKITPGGKCKLVWFTDHTSDYSLTGNDEFTDDAYGIGFSDESLTWEDLEGYTWEEMEQLRWSEIDYYYQQMHIHALTVKQTEDDIGVTVPSNAGNVTTYMIVDNPFLVHSTDAEVTAYIQPIFNRLDAFGGYLPMNMSCVGNPLIEAGDIINVEVRGEIVALPIFYKTMMCTASCTDNYEATGTVNREQVSSDVREKLSQGGRMHIFRNNIDELYSAIFDNNGNSKIAQNASGIELLAEGKYDIQSGIDIKSEGIEIKGGKYVKIFAGSGSYSNPGIFEVDVTNFKIDSVNKYFKTGYWTINENDIAFEYPYQNKFRILNKNRYGRNGGQPFSDDTDNMGIIIRDGRMGFFGYEHESSTLYGVTFEYPLYDSYSHELISRITIGKRFKYDSYDNDFEEARLCLCCTSLEPQSVSYGSAMSCIADKEESYVGTNTNMYWYGFFHMLVCDDFYNNSSKYIKHNIKELTSVGETLDKLQPVSFVYNNDKEGKTNFGLIHEDTVDILPEICRGDKDAKTEEKAINYIALVPLLLKEIQELRKRVATLEDKVNELERK